MLGAIARLITNEIWNGALRDPGPERTLDGAALIARVSRPGGLLTGGY